MSSFFDSVFLFVTMAFPKAGTQLGELPLTLNLMLLALLLAFGLPTALRALGEFRGMLPWFVCLVVFGIFSTLISWQEGASLYSIAQHITVMVSPLAAVATFRLPTQRSLRIIAWALLLTSIYALAQFVAGITESSIAGLTYTMGQELELKPIGYTSEGDNAAKMPSTYQNGNSFGIFAALAVMLMLTWRPVTKALQGLRVAAILSGVVGLLLCGSRSIVIPVALSLIIVVYQYVATFSRRTQLWAMVIIITGILCGVLYLMLFSNTVLNAFWQRNVVQTIGDPTATGRTEQWSDMWSGISSLDGLQLLRLIIIGQSPSWGLGGEGLPEFFVTFGLPATLAFFGSLFIIAHRLWHNPPARTVALGILCVIFAFMVDQSYFYPPNIMNVYLVATLALNLTPPQATNGLALPGTTDSSTEHPKSTFIYKGSLARQLT